MSFNVDPEEERRQAEEQRRLAEFREQIRRDNDALILRMTLQDMQLKEDARRFERSQNNQALMGQQRQG